MNLAISNIAWDAKEDKEIYKLMREYNFTGLEIAPTRFFLSNPYDTDKDRLLSLKKEINKENLEIIALQSILYGKPELKLFETERQRERLNEYLKKSIIFAYLLGAKVLVFGSPKNRIMKDKDTDYSIAIEFFKEIGNYAAKYNVKICIEANPKVYNTNFINTTNEALKFVKKVNNEGCGLHVDIGTIILNNEDISVIEKSMNYINHIHLSEPFLNLINQENSDFHKKIAKILRKNKYNNWVSIEMKKVSEISIFESINKVLNYVSNIFGGDI